MQDDSPKKSIKDRIKNYLPLTTAFVAGSITTAVVIRYRNGIGLNELIWMVPIDELRERVKEGSPHILETPNGPQYCVKINRSGGHAN